METTFQVRGKLVHLGRIPSEAREKVVKLVDYIDRAALPPLEDEFSWGNGIEEWPMAGNDREGCCVTSSDVHMHQICTKHSDDAEVKIPDAETHAYYRAQTGGRDTGLSLLGSARYWTTHPFGGVKLIGYADVSGSDPSLKKYACKLFSSCKLGVSLPRNFQEEINAGKPWASTRFPPDPGLGHAVPVVGWTRTHFKLITWGMEQLATYQWVAKYCDEALTLLHPKWLDRHKPPVGVDLARWREDFRSITGEDAPPWDDPTPPDPAPTPSPIDDLITTFALREAIGPGIYQIVRAAETDGQLQLSIDALLKEAQRRKITPAQWQAIMQIIMMLIQMFGGNPVPVGPPTV